MARVRNAAEAMGYERDAVQMKLYSLGPLRRDGEEVSMSKRAGEFITLDDLLAEVGIDAARWFFASRAATTGFDFDIELAKKQSTENPVYYVQYAHARIASILRKAAEAGLTPAATSTACWPARPRRRSSARSRASRRSSRTRSRSRRRRASRPTRRSSRRPFHAFYRDARVVDAAEPGRSAGAARARPRRRRSRSRTRSGCWGSPRPSRCRRRAPSRADRSLAGQAEDVRDARHRVRVARDEDPRTLPPSPGRTWAIPCALQARSSRPSRTRPRRRPCPRRS